MKFMQHILLSIILITRRLDKFHLMRNIKKEHNFIKLIESAFIYVGIIKAYFAFLSHHAYMLV